VSSPAFVTQVTLVTTAYPTVVSKRVNSSPIVVWCGMAEAKTFGLENCR